MNHSSGFRHIACGTIAISGNLIKVTALSSLIALANTTFAAVESKRAVKHGSLLEEIVVTARKREESLQDTPVSVTAFTADALEDISASQLITIGEYTPNMEFNMGSGGSANQAHIYIRGIGQSDFLISSDPGVGMYVDGVYFARTFGGILDLMDLERVEVLRGPQGTLFGKNTIGGAVNIITQKPGEEYSGKLSLTAGRFDRADVAATINIPLVEDELFLRLSGASNNRDGYGRRLSDGVETGNIESNTGRARLRWLASEDLEIDFSVDATVKDEESLPMSLLRVEPVNSGILALYNALVAGPAGMPIDESLLLDNPYNSYAGVRSVNDLDVWGASTTITWDLADNLQMKSITAYRDMQIDFSTDLDSSPNEYADVFRNNEQDQFSQEFQLSGESFNSRLDWITGLYYFEESGSELNTQNVFVGLYPIIGLDASIVSLFEAETESYAAFVHGTYEVTGKTRVTAGLRYTYEEKQGNIYGERPFSGEITADVALNNSWESLSPKLGIDYHWNDDTMLFANVSRGFKSGGYNGRATDGAELQPYDPEYVWVYEAGLKYRGWDGRLQVNLTGFFNDYTDIQLSSAMADPADPSGTSIIVAIQNAGEAETTGFELELLAKPMDGLDLHAEVGYTDAEFVKLNPGVDAVSLSHKFVDLPRWNVSGGIKYSFPVGDGYLSLRTDASYKSEVYRDVTNSSELLQEGYTLVSARVSYTPEDEKWQVALFGTNITGEEYIHRGVGLAEAIGITSANWGRPAEWGLNFTYNF